jgi:hypothetical protein
MSGLATTGGAALAAGVGGGALLGGGVAYEMNENGLLGIGREGAVKTAGGEFIDFLTGDTENAYLANYLKTHNGAAPPGYEWKNGGVYRIDQETVEEYATGGTVPGAIGEPQKAIVHGGERIIPVGQNQTMQVSGDFIHIDRVDASNPADVNALLEKIAAAQKRQNTAQGIGTAI